MLIFVGIPSADGKLHLETARSLMAEQVIADDLGHELCMGVVEGCSLITHARNDLVSTFLASGADVLMFVDSDVSWPAGALTGLATRPEPFVGGAYRYKREPEAYPVAWLESRQRTDEGLIEVAALPGGFTAVNREVFLQLQHARPKRFYRFGETLHYAFFEAPYGHDRLWGEDNYFCQTWRDLGGSVWLNPDITLTHHGGSSPFTGRVADWLKTET